MESMLVWKSWSEHLGKVMVDNQTLQRQIKAVTASTHGVDTANKHVVAFGDGRRVLLGREALGI